VAPLRVVPAHLICVLAHRRLGVVMLAADLEAKLGNRLFPPKMLLVARGVAFMASCGGGWSSRARPRPRRRLALASLACWPAPSPRPFHGLFQ